MTHEPDLAAYKTRIDADTRLHLDLERDLVFVARTGRGYEIEFDARVEWGCMPTEALLAASVGCLAIDVVSILRRMRGTVERFRVDVVGHRKPVPPQYFHGIELQLAIAGSDIDDGKVARAVELSKGRYCSVYHTLRPDIEFDIQWTIEPV